MPGDIPVTITSDASTASERTGRYRLHGVADAVARDGFSNPAVITLHFLKQGARMGTVCQQAEPILRDQTKAGASRAEAATPSISISGVPA